ncbi:O87 family O-antigen flippase [Escherichia coli]|uniref:O87 family O-antigen flippase n=1 Tax=Escherichia coli TaxID=562 RepID=UPI001C7093AA|nr:O87 family O-antigen flippase [Escherichia coli]MBW9470752.1 O87 family O-antigen flippase [Escherichia coli]
MKLNTTLNKNIIYLGLVQGSSYILPLITFPYLVRVLGPEFFGVLGFCQASMQYLVLITDYGFNWTATQQIAKHRDNKLKINEIFWSVIFAKIFLASISFILLFVICWNVPKYHDVWYVLLSFSPFLLGNVIYPIWFFQGMEKMKAITVCTISARFLLIPLIFLLVHNSDDIWIAAIIQSSVNLLAGILSCCLIFKYRWISGFEFNLIKVKESICEGWHVFISTSAISLYTTSTTVILGFVAGNTAVGYFNAANTVRNAAQGLLNPVTQAIYPRVSALYEIDYVKALNLIKKMLRYIGGIAFLGSVILFFLAPVIIKYGLGDSYNNAVSILRWMAFLPFIILLSNIFGVQTMLTHGYKKQFSNILTVSGVLNLCIIYPLVCLYSADGAAIAMLITEIFVSFTMFCFLKNKKINIFK